MQPQQHAGAYLNRADELSPVMDKARRLLELRAAVIKLLPPSLSRSCTVANARQGRVVMFAESSVAAAKLKLVLPTLRNQLVQAGQEVTSMVVEVQPPSGRPRSALARPLSTSAADALNALADRLPDSELRQILKKLASRASRRA